MSDKPTSVIPQSASARTRVCETIRFLGSEPFIVEVCDEVSIPTERTVRGKTVYETAGYVPVHLLRRATREELDEWRWGCP